MKNSQFKTRSKGNMSPYESWQLQKYGNYIPDQQTSNSAETMSELEMEAETAIVAIDRVSDLCEQPPNIVIQIANNFCNYQPSF